MSLRVCLLVITPVNKFHLVCLEKIGNNGKIEKIHQNQHKIIYVILKNELQYRTEEEQEKRSTFETQVAHPTKI